MMKKKVKAPERQRTATAASPAEGEPSFRVGVAALIFFGLSLVFFLPAFLPGRGIYGTDYLGGGFPFYHFISERLSDGALPKWVPYVFGGMPLFANPGSTYYPLHFLFDLVLPVSRIFPAVFWFQIGIAGLGMYLLAGELGCRRWIALLAGLAYQFTGITISWVYAGHDGRIIVATLIPIFFYFLHRGIRTRDAAPFAGAAATLGFALLSFQIQLSYYMLLAAGIWGVFCLFRFGWVRQPAALGRTVAFGLGAVATGFLLAAINFLPFLGYVPESPRGQEGGRGYEYSISFSMPPSEVLAIAVPEHHGASVTDMDRRPLFPAYRGDNPFKLHTEYTGALVVVLLVLGFYYARKDRYWLFFLGLGVFMLTIALGGYTPLYRLYYAVLPGTPRFRAPSLSFFVVAFSLVAMAALTLERIASLRAVQRDRKGRGTEPTDRIEVLPWVAGGVVAVSLFGAVIAAGGVESPPGFPSIAAGWGRFALFAGLVSAGLWLWSRERLTTIALVSLLAIVTVADLWVIGRRFFHTVDPPSVWFAPDDVVAFLRRQPEPFRVWTFPFPQHYRGAGAYGGNDLMLFGIEQVGGEHPVPLQRWNEFVGEGTTTMIDWHNLITNAEVVNTADGPAISFQTRAGFLEAANVRYIVSLAPLVHPTLREAHRGSAFVYEKTDALPRAYLVQRVVEVPREQTVASMTAEPWDPGEVAFVGAGTGLTLPDTPLEGAVQVLHHTPDRVVLDVTASRDAFLVLADNHYDGWRATLYGEELEIVLANHTFRGVTVPAGRHTLEFEFRPRDLYAGMYITLAGLVLLAGYGILLLVRMRRAAAPAASP
jgi:hypothetical protein